MKRLLLVLLCALALVGAACSSDGSDGTAEGDGSTTTGDLSLSDEVADDLQLDPLVETAIAEYKTYVGEQIDEMIPAVKVFTDAVRAGDVEAAKAAYAESRENWERIEPIAGLVESTDGAVDARVDDFESEDDEAWTGWHRLEYELWVEGELNDETSAMADHLDEELATLQTDFADLEMPPTAVAIGAAELIEEVSEGKITGEEDRYSKTDLWDFAANVEGAEAVIDVLEPALEDTDPELLADIRTNFDELWEKLDTFRDGEGWVLYCVENDEYPSDECTATTVTEADIDELSSMLAATSENLALVPGTLGIS